MPLDVIRPDWPAPKNVRALVTTRQGGVSQPPYDDFNLAMHVGDNPEQVQRNRQQLQQVLETPYEPQWLQQVHGCRVVPARADGEAPEADASFTRQPGLPCAVLTADCLPVLFCTTGGDQVAAAHAGWRGLADGILEATLRSFNAPASEIMAWLGPAIGPEQFEVGADVRDAFLTFSADSAWAFTPHPVKDGYWFGDMYQLACQRLVNQGVVQIYGGSFCTYNEKERFFSYRRNEVTGRMASIVWLSA